MPALERATAAYAAWAALNDTADTAWAARLTAARLYYGDKYAPRDDDEVKRDLVWVWKSLAGQTALAGGKAGARRPAKQRGSGTRNTRPSFKAAAKRPRPAKQAARLNSPRARFAASPGTPPRKGGSMSKSAAALIIGASLLAGGVYAKMIIDVAEEAKNQGVPFRFFVEHAQFWNMPAVIAYKWREAADPRFGEKAVKANLHEIEKKYPMKGNFVPVAGELDGGPFSREEIDAAANDFRDWYENSAAAAAAPAGRRRQFAWEKKGHKFDQPFIAEYSKRYAGIGPNAR